MLLETHNFEFGEFLLDVREKVLLHGGTPLSITPKAFQLLLLLLEKHGHLVEKDELMKSVWADSFVEQGNITFTIGLLRRVLQDDTKNPRFIETVPKRGYRFIADVQRVEFFDEIADTRKLSEAEKRNQPLANFAVSTSDRSAVVALADWRREATAYESRERPLPATATDQSAEQISSPGLLPPKTRPAGRYFHKYRLPAIALALFLIGAIGSTYYFFYSQKTTFAIQGSKTIAVLPVRPINSTSRDEDYEIGIADSLIRKINSMENLFARPLNATRKYTDIEQDSLAVGREQKVDYVLASNYQLAGGKIRLTAQLLRVESGLIVETYITEKDAGELFVMQDAIAGEIGNRLMEQFSTIQSGPAAIRGTDNEDAYRFYLQGMYLYDRRTLADAENALDKLERAIQLDPSYAKAWAGKAHVHRSLGYFSVNRSTADDYRNSMHSVNRALELDANLGDAHSALCENKYFYEYDYNGAERACRRAIELDPNSFLAREIYSRCLWTLKRFDEAIVQAKIAIDLQPTSLFSQRNYGISLFYARRNSEAVQQFRRVSEMDPNFVANYAWFVPALLVQGSKAEAFEWFIKWQTLLNVSEATILDYKKAYQASGWQGVGRERVKRFDEIKIRSYFLEACLTAHTGDKEKTFEYLEKSLQRREWGIPFLQIDPSLDGLRDDPRLKELVSRVGFNKDK